MTAAAQTTLAPKHAGERAASEVLERVPALGHVPDSVAPHYDAVVVDDVLDEALDAVLRRGRRVEIKSAMVVYADGQRGRFYFRPAQHQTLVDLNGVYLLAVCEPTPERAVIAMTIVDATRVDDCLPEWFNGGDGRSDYAQLAWSNFFDPEEVTAGE